MGLGTTIVSGAFYITAKHLSVNGLLCKTLLPPQSLLPTQSLMHPQSQPLLHQWSILHSQPLSHFCTYIFKLLLHLLCTCSLKLQLLHPGPTSLCTCQYLLCDLASCYIQTSVKGSLAEHQLPLQLPLIVSS